MADQNYFTPVSGQNENADGHVVNPDEKPIGEPEVRPVAESEPAKDDPDAFTHYVHLADGRVLRANLPGHPETVGSRYYETKGEGEDAVETSVPVIGVYAR